MCIYVCACLCVCVYVCVCVALPQDGWTAVLLVACYGYQSLVQELCETFGADLLHRMKVRGILYVYLIIMCGCTHRMTVSQP